MKKLNDSTIRFISSSYVISSIESLVKELVENSLDAGGCRIWINLKKFGLDKVDVTDDGSGFSDTSLICQKHCTSKISQFSDIETVNTFGFRGEVLSSVCAVSNLSIISNSNGETSSLGNNWLFDKMGNIIAHNNVPCKQGTTISVSNIFHNLPVRCQMYKSLFILQKTLKSILLNLQHLYLSKKNIHLKLINDNNIILNLPITSSRNDSISFVIGSNKFKYFREIVKSGTIGGLEIEMDLFVPNCVDDKMGLTHHDYKEACFLFINDRPVEIACIFNCVRSTYNRFTKQESSRYPFMFLYLTLPKSWVDVNYDPEKRKIKLSNTNQIVDFIETNLKLYYDSLQADSSDIDRENDIINQQTELSKLDDEKNRRFPVENSNFNDESRKSTIDNSVPATRTDEVVKDFSILEKIIDVPSVSDGLIGNNNIDIDRNGPNLNEENHIELDRNYPIGRVEKIEGNPVRNVNLKRVFTDSDDNLIDSKIKRVEIPPEKVLNNAGGINSNLLPPINISPNPKCSAFLSLDNLDKRNESIQNSMVVNDKIKVIACWDTFVLCVEMCFPNDHNEVEIQNLVILSQEKLVFTSIYFLNLTDMQIPATKLQIPFVIDDNNKEIVDYLLKLPVQLIYNRTTGEKFHVVSCPHLIKNGYRIHQIKTEENNFFEIITKPEFIDENNMVEEINYILLNSLTSTSVVRTSENRRWIYLTSEKAAKLKLQNEIGKLTGKRLREYFTLCMSNIYKCRLSERLDEFLPELFRFSLNKC